MLNLGIDLIGLRLYLLPRRFRFLIESLVLRAFLYFSLTLSSLWLDAV